MASGEQELRRTSLYETHKAAGAKMVPFAGYEMPVQYTGVIDEHHAVREAAGLFDVSHMGEFEARGKDAGVFIHKMVTNNVLKLEVGGVLYAAMCRAEGGIVDDLTVYRLEEERYMAVVNAANIEKDWEWMSSHHTEDCEFENVSEETGLLALQGPKAESILGTLIPGGGDIEDIPYYGARYKDVAGCEVLVSRTGYTGEDGFELYCKSPDAPRDLECADERGRGRGTQALRAGRAGYLAHGDEIRPVRKRYRRVHPSTRGGPRLGGEVQGGGFHRTREIAGPQGRRSKEKTGWIRNGGSWYSSTWSARPDRRRSGRRRYERDDESLSWQSHRDRLRSCVECG